MSGPYDSYGYPLEADVQGEGTAPTAPPAFDLNKLMAELDADEGRRRKAYRCTAGKLSIGVGRNLDANGLRDSEIDLMLRNDINQAECDLDYLDPGWREHPDEVQRAMLNLVFNLGASGWKKFFNTRAALARRDYDVAADLLALSKWAKQVQTSRRDRIIAQIRGPHAPR